MPLISQIYFWNKTTCFRQFLCPSSGVFHCTYSNGICHTALLTVCELDRDVSSRSSSQALELHVSDNSSLHHQEFFTVHTALVYVIQVCRQPASWIGMFCPDPARRLSADLYDKYHCCMYSEKLLMMDRGTV